MAIAVAAGGPFIHAYFWFPGVWIANLGEPGKASAALGFGYALLINLFLDWMILYALIFAVLRWRRRRPTQETL